MFINSYNTNELLHLSNENLEYILNSGSKTNPIGTKVSDELKNYLKEYCRVNNISLSELIRFALAKYLEDELAKTTENSGNFLIMAVPVRG